VSSATLTAVPREFLRQPLRIVAMRLLFPLMMVNIAIGNQVWEVGGMNPGQPIFFLVLALALTVLAGSLRNSLWACVFAAAIVAGRVLEAATGISTVYYVALNAAFLLVGIILALEAPTLVYRQVRFFLALCVPVMFLQVMGAGEWTQALNTEYLITEADAWNPKTVYPLLFQPIEYVEWHYSVGQGRPPGLLHANNVLSLIIIFGFVLQFGRAQRKNATWTDAILIACLVMAMAKIALFVVFLLMLWMWMLRDSVSSARATRVFWLIVIMYGLYALLFPGLFGWQLSGYKIMYSISVRVFDLLEVFQGLDDSQRSAIVNMMGDAQTYDYASDEDVGKLSGYALILNYWPVVAAIGLLMTPIFFTGLSRLRALYPVIAATAFGAAVTVVLYPAAVPFFRAQLYWFIFGFAAIPFLFLVAPRFVHRLIAQGREEGFGSP
jgi:hypothetical protein